MLFQLHFPFRGIIKAPYTNMAFIVSGIIFYYHKILPDRILQRLVIKAAKMYN